MRHLNPKTRDCYGYYYVTTKPNQRPYTYEKASPNRKYVQVLDFVGKHPGCKRFDIQCAVWNINRECNTPHGLRGYMSLVFSNLLYDNLIDYNQKYQYMLTFNGLKVLQSAKGC